MTDDIKTMKIDDMSSGEPLTYERDTLESTEEKIDYDVYGDPQLRHYIQKATTVIRSTKKSKKIEKYEQRKLLRKEIRKKKKQNRQQKNMASAASRTGRIMKTTRQIYTMANSTNKHTVVLDLSYEEFMDSKGMAKCANQVARSYSINRRCPNPVQLHICSFKGKMKSEISKIDGYDKWDVHFHEKSYLANFHPAKLIYLSSDATYVLNELDPNKVYIIGGFVDHNSYKGVSFNKARTQGIISARLPLDSNILLKTSSVLAINHVFEILLEVSNGATWREAFRKVIPQRKIRDKVVQGEPSHLNSHRPKREIAESDDPEHIAGDNLAAECTNPVTVNNKSQEINCSQEETMVKIKEETTVSNTNE